MGKIIAIANQKGGVGKTTTAVNLGFKLAKSRKKVLLIDLDTQANLTMCMGYQQPDELVNSISDILVNAINEDNNLFDDYIIKLQDNLDFIPSNINLSAVELALVNTMSREHVLKNMLEQIKEEYDYIIIDCMPSLSMLTINALVAADGVLIPVQAQFLSAKGLELLLKTISKVKKNLNKGLQIEGILITMIDKNTKFTKNIIQNLHEAYGEYINIFNNMIPRSVKAIESSSEGISIFDYSKNSKVANAYSEFTEEFLKR